MTKKGASPAHAAIGGHDAPIQDEREDLYGSIAVARAIHRVLGSAPSNWSTRVALYGAWGSGKTSVLNLLEQLETRADSIVVRFSAWAATGQAGIIALFYASLAERLQTENIRPPWLTRAKAAVTTKGWLGKAGNIIGRGAEATGQVPPGTTDIIAGATELASSWVSVKKTDIDDLVAQLRGRRVVVFIDDLDRADPVAIPKTLLALRELLDWPSFAFVLAFDRRIVGQALGEYSRAYGDNAHAFLEKIIDIPFRLPIPTRDQQRALAVQSFSACCPFVPTQIVEEFAALLPHEPRRVKIIARCLGALREVALRHDPQELDWTGLVLHAVLQEASPQCEAAIVAASTDEKSPFALLIADEDRKDREALLSKELAKLYSDASSDEERNRTVRVAVDLHRHWEYMDPNRVRYHLSLQTSDPPLTWREFRQFAGRLRNARTDGVVAEAIDAITKLGFKEDDASRALLDFAVQDYSDSLSMMAEQRSEAGWNLAIERATNSLSNAEFLWGHCTVAAVQNARKLADLCVPLIGLVTKWIAWTRNEGEADLRTREQTLALRAAEECSTPAAVFESTDPYWDDRPTFDAASADLVRNWTENLRARLAPRIVDEVIKRLARPSGIADVAGGEPQILAWFLESPKSPIYQVQDLTQKVARCFSGHENTGGTNPDPVQQNAITYLRILLFKTRDGTWGGPDRLPIIVASAPEIVPAAWAAAVRHRVPFRMLNSLRELRRDLAVHGVPIEALPNPPWLLET